MVPASREVHRRDLLDSRSSGTRRGARLHRNFEQAVSRCSRRDGLSTRDPHEGSSVGEALPASRPAGSPADMTLGDRVIAVTAVHSDTPGQDGELGSLPTGLRTGDRRRHAARSSEVAYGRAMSTGTFLQPDEGQYARWSRRGCSRSRWPQCYSRSADPQVAAGCLLTVSDVVVEGEFVRISDEEMRAAVDQMTELALRTITADKH